MTPELRHLCRIDATLGPPMEMGQGQAGIRRIIPITGGTFEGPGIKGTIIAGGWDWQLARADGCTDIRPRQHRRYDRPGSCDGHSEREPRHVASRQRSRTDDGSGKSAHVLRHQRRIDQIDV